MDQFLIHINNVLLTYFILCFQVGLRKREYYLIAGSIFAVWQRIESQINKHSQSISTQKLQVVRLKTAEGRRIVGVLIPKSCVSHIIDDLEKDSVSADLVAAAQASGKNPTDLFGVCSSDKTDENDNLDE